MTGAVGHRGLLLAGDAAGGVIGMLQALGAFLIFPHTEASGTTALNEGTGPDGTYSGAITLGRPALYPGGGTSFRMDEGGARATYPGASVVASSDGFSMGVVASFPDVSALCPLINRDNAGVGGGSGARSWQFRLYSGNLQAELLRGGYASIAAAHGAANNTPFFAGFRYKKADGKSRLFRNGTAIGSEVTAPLNIDHTAVDGMAIVVGNYQGYNAGINGAHYAMAFVIPSAIPDSAFADLASAMGF